MGKTAAEPTFDDLKPAGYNPRAISGDAAAGLQASLKRFGDVSGIVWNQRTGTLIAGHQRVEQLRALGAVIEGREIVVGGQRFAIRVVDWSPEQERAANVTANNPYISGHFTTELQGLLEEIKLDFASAGDDDLFGALKLEDLLLPDAWGLGTEAVDDTEANLDGITATIKVKCPQDIKDEVLIYLKAKFLEVSFEGVEIV